MATHSGCTIAEREGEGESESESESEREREKERARDPNGGGLARERELIWSLCKEFHQVHARCWVALIIACSKCGKSWNVCSYY